MLPTARTLPQGSIDSKKEQRVFALQPKGPVKATDKPPSWRSMMRRAWLLRSSFDLSPPPRDLLGHAPTHASSRRCGFCVVNGGGVRAQPLWMDAGAAADDQEQHQQVMTTRTKPVVQPERQSIDRCALIHAHQPHHHHHHKHDRGCLGPREAAAAAAAAAHRRKLGLGARSRLLLPHIPLSLPPVSSQ